MLVELRIRGVAIIDAVSLSLSPGFNVLSGETGAGKSIIVGALGLLLGERGHADVVRTGVDRATVEGTFDASSSASTLALLEERGIEVEEARVVLKRELSASGRTRAWINGTSVTAGQLAEIGRLLVNLHGQHEAQQLLDPSAQRQILDAYAGATGHTRRVTETHAALQTVRAERTSLAHRRAEAERRADYLRHVVRELGDAQLTLGEDERLTEDIRRRGHVEELRGHVVHVREALEEEESGIHARVAVVRRALGAAQRVDASLQRHGELLSAATVHLEELARELRDYEDGLDTDPARLAQLEQRRDLVFRLTSKYGGTVGAALEALAQGRAELDLVDSAGFDLQAIEAREQSAVAALHEAARLLTEHRRSAGATLATAVSCILPSLGIADGHLDVSLTPLEVIDATGAESVEFRVSLNVGHEDRPLARVASGGELSRLMLALKTVLAAVDAVPTLVFDEVDAGIGGRVALQVGDALRALAATHQVLVITHLAQIAARAHHHVVVSKGARDGLTTADIAVAADESRVAEIARMLSGTAESDASLVHARELLAEAAAPAPRATRPRPSSGRRTA